MQCPYRHSSVQTSIPSTHHIPQQDNFKCAIEECHERRHKDPQGVVHECCCYTHAMEHMRRTEEGKLLDWLALVYALIVGYKIVRTHDPFHRGNRNFWGIGSICVVHGDGVTFSIRARIKFPFWICIHYWLLWESCTFHFCTGITL